MPEKPTDRAGLRLAWVREILHDPAITLTPASSDASFRSYWRTVGRAPALVVMDAPPPREDIRPWIAIGRQLAAAGLHVPAVHASDAERGFALIEDFGDRLYLDALDEASADTLYAEALDALLRMQTRMPTGDLAPYDADFLRGELAQLQPWFLERHLGHPPDPAQRKILERAFEVLVDNALQQPQCFVHRDFHSRNLMLVEAQRPGVIDFQGALYGPITYDLVSLLRDCYIAWDEHRVDTWRERHRSHLIRAGLLDAGTDAACFRRWFDLTGLQRHLKVLGIFCRLAQRDGKPGYLTDLPRVFDYVVRVASRYPELAELAALLRDATDGHALSRAFTTSDPAPTPCAP